MGPLHGAFGDPKPLDPTVEQELRSLPNVHFTGALPYDEVPIWLEAMDVLLIAYDLEAQGTRATSSHKLLEYLASGKVVISSYLEDHVQLSDLLVMTKQGQRITERVDEALDDLPQLNAEKLRLARKAYAASRSYSGYLHKIGDLLQAVDQPTV
ncbi:MAG: glycosyltransferase [Flavobacteriales bacterium]|nr:glycosyltransferase [Flavobacteriales bacterium]